MSRALSVFAASTAIALAACSQTSGSASDGPLPSTASEAVSEAPPDPPSQAPGHAIATVVTHDAKVTVMGSGGGSDLRFVVRKLDGAIVADNITENTLRSTDPVLHAIVTSAVASNDRVRLSGRSQVGKEYVDATLDSRGSSTAPAALGPGQPLGL